MQQFAFSVYVAQRKSCSCHRRINSTCPRFIPEKTSAAETKKAHSAGKTKSTPNVKQNKPKPNSCKKRKLDSCHDKSGIHFSHAGRYEKCTVGDTAAVSKAAEANGNIVSRRSCHAP